MQEGEGTLQHPSGPALPQAALEHTPALNIRGA